MTSSSLASCGRSLRWPSPSSSTSSLRRFKRIDFPNVRFLKDVAQQTRARKKVRHWLTLLARMAALACLVLAFAQPYIPALMRL